MEYAREWAVSLFTCYLIQHRLPCYTLCKTDGKVSILALKISFIWRNQCIQPLIPCKDIRVVFLLFFYICLVKVHCIFMNVLAHEHIKGNSVLVTSEKFENMWFKNSKIWYNLMYYYHKHYIVVYWESKSDIWIFITIACYVKQVLRTW